MSDPKDTPIETEPLEVDPEAPPVAEPETDEAAEPASSVDDVLAAANAERDQYKEALQRLQADFENFRKRMMKQQAEGADRANESLVAKILPVIDTIELAQAHEPSGTLEQVSIALLEALNKEGLERIASVNEPFDPNLHDAVAHEPGEGESKVSEEMRAGYRWKGRVLRPAMVKVVG